MFNRFVTLPERQTDKVALHRAVCVLHMRTSHITLNSGGFILDLFNTVRRVAQTSRPKPQTFVHYLRQILTDFRHFHPDTFCVTTNKVDVAIRTTTPQLRRCTTMRNINFQKNHYYNHRIGAGDRQIIIIIIFSDNTSS